MPKAKPPGSNQHQDRLHSVTDAPTLAEIGIDKRTSSRAQKLAALPEKTFAAVAAGEINEIISYLGGWLTASCAISQERVPLY